MKTKLIGICGAINSGKSTATDMLLYCLNSPKFLRKYWIFKILKGKSFINNWHITSFADSLKQILATLIHVDRDKFEDRNFKEHFYVCPNTLNTTWSPPIGSTLKDNKFNKIIADKDPIISTKYLTIRQMMQWFGTHILTSYFGENVWVNSTLTRNNNKNTIISDVRFLKEAHAIRKNGGKIIIIERPDIPVNSNHISEKEWMAIRDKKLYIAKIINNGSLEDLFNSIKSIIDCL